MRLTNFRRLGVILLGLFVFYAFSGFVIIPWVLQKKLPEAFATVLADAQAKVGGVSLNPFALSLTLRNFVIADGRAKRLVAFDEAYANFQLASLFRRSYEFAEIRVTAPYVLLEVTKERSLNLTNLLKDNPQREPGAPSSTPKIAIHKLAIERGVIHFSDPHREAPYIRKLDPIDINLRDLSTEAAPDGTLDFRAASPDGELLSAKAAFGLSPLHFDWHLNLQQLRLKSITDYFVSRLDFAPQTVLDADIRLLMAAGPDGLSWELNAGDFHLQNATLLSRADGEELIRVPDAAVHGLTARTGSEVRIKSFETRGGHVVVTISPERVLNLSLLAPGNDDTANAPSSAEQQAASSPFALAIEQARLTDYSVKFIDRSIDPPAAGDLSQVRIEFSDFATRGKVSKIHCAGNANIQGKLSCAGDLALDPLRLNLDFDLTEIDLESLGSYFTKLGDLSARGAKVSSKGHLRIGTAASDDSWLDLSLGAQIDQASFVRPSRNSELASFAHLSVARLGYKLDPSSLRVEGITLREPKGTLAIEKDGALNLTGLFPAKSDAPAAPPEKSAPPIPFSYQDIRIENGSFPFIDNSVSPSFKTQLDVKVATLDRVTNGPTGVSNFNFDALLDHYAPVKISGTLLPLDFPRETKLQSTITNYSLPSLSPYSGKYIGYPFNKGALSIKSAIQVVSGDVTASNEIRLNQIVLGARLPKTEAPDLPVHFALSVARDSAGLVHLNLPVSGKMGSPEFSYTSVLYDQLINLIWKAAKSPFSILGSLYGGGEEIRFIEFDPGSSSLSSHEQDNLSIIARILNDHAELQLSVKGRASLLYDFPNTVVDEPLALALGNQRAVVIRDFFLNKNPSLLDRIFVLQPELIAPPKAGRVQVELSLSGP